MAGGAGRVVAPAVGVGFGIADLADWEARVRSGEVEERAWRAQAAEEEEALRAGLWAALDGVRPWVGVEVDGDRAVIRHSGVEETGFGEAIEAGFAAWEPGMRVRIERASEAAVAAALRGEEWRAERVEAAEFLLTSKSEMERENGAPAAFTTVQWLPLLTPKPPVIVRPPLPRYPVNPSEPPGPGYVWRGRPGSPPGGRQGNWYNPETGEWLRPDLDHKPPIQPHWDYRAPDGAEFRWYPGGELVPK